MFHLCFVVVCGARLLRFSLSRMRFCFRLVSGAVLLGSARVVVLVSCVAFLVSTGPGLVASPNRMPPDGCVGLL